MKIAAIALLLMLVGCTATAKNVCVAKCAECKNAELSCDFERSGNATVP